LDYFYSIDTAKMRSLPIILGLISTFAPVFAQALFYNNGAQMFMNPGSVMIVKNASVDNNTGRIDNAGNLIIEGDFTNSDVATGNASSTGIYDIYGNWINNASFFADESTVQLSGANQLITGTQKTIFYNLFLTGSGVKTQTIDAQVEGTLDLRNAELATDIYEMLVSNFNTNAVLRNAGFVSSLQTGRLSRVTNANAAYLFPTGSSVGTTRYRPVEIIPATNASNIYGVRLANVDATSETFDRNIKENELCEINPLFYHHIHRTLGIDAATISFFYNAATDGDWTTIAHWQNLPQWEDMENATASTVANFDVLTKNNWNNFSNIPYALAKPAPTVVAERDTQILLGDDAPLNAIVNQNVNTYTWFPSTDLSCADCPNPVASPDKTTRYTVTVNQGSGCSATDSVLVAVIANLNLYLPNAFSPNNDGNNDILKLYGDTDRIFTLNLKIFNRWGEKVFEATDAASAVQGWDGTYMGKLLDPGVFAYQLEVTYKRGIKDPIKQKGSITLIR
jgi:gliding motility-associated-like protein